MASLLTDAQKASLSDVIVSVADSFERDIFAYKDPEITIITTNPNYNRFQGHDQNNTENPTNTPKPFLIRARILYGDKLGYPFAAPYVGGSADEAQLKVRVPDGQVRIKVGSAGYEVLKDSKKIEFDSVAFTVDSIERPHGLFGTQYYTFYLARMK